jgi:hypothetical protein
MTHVNRDQTLQLTVKRENGKSLGSCSIDAANMIRDFTLAGARLLQKLAANELSSEVDESMHIDDSDSKESFGPWETIRDTGIPSCVKCITFTIAEGAATPAALEQLRRQFPGVIVVTDGAIAVRENTREKHEEEEAKIQRCERKASTSPPKAAAVRRSRQKRSPRIPPHTMVRRSGAGKN